MQNRKCIEFFFVSKSVKCTCLSCDSFPCYSFVDYNVESKCMMHSSVLIFLLRCLLQNLLSFFAYRSLEILNRQFSDSMPIKVLKEEYLPVELKLSCPFNCPFLLQSSSPPYPFVEQKLGWKSLKPVHAGLEDFCFSFLRLYYTFGAASCLVHLSLLS